MSRSGFEIMARHAQREARVAAAEAKSPARVEPLDVPQDPVAKLWGCAKAAAEDFMARTRNAEVTDAALLELCEDMFQRGVDAGRRPVPRRGGRTA